MLYQLGNTQFEVIPLNPVTIDHGGEASFAEKPVVGTRPPLEFTGEGPETFVIAAKLFPEKFGGLSSLDGMHQQRRSGKALPFMRGDGRALGYYVIESIDEKSTYLDQHGVGRIIEIDIALRRAQQGGGGGGFSILGLFT